VIKQGQDLPEKKSRTVEQEQEMIKKIMLSDRAVARPIFALKDGQILAAWRDKQNGLVAKGRSRGAYTPATTRPATTTREPGKAARGRGPKCPQGRRREAAKRRRTDAGWGVPRRRPSGGADHRGGAMSATQFVRNPIAFMNKHIILADVVQDQAEHRGCTGVRRFTLDPYDGVQVTNPTHNDAAAYRLNDLPFVEGPPLPDQDSLFAYWCPYKANHQLGVMLERDAPYMFTAVMDGCSLGIGSACSDGSRAVFHANLESKAGKMDPSDRNSVQKAVRRQVKEQNKMLGYYLVPEGNIVDPEFYGGGVDQSTGGFGGGYSVKLKSTTVALWDNGNRKWTFHTLRYRKLSGRSYEHHGLHQFAPLV
jgi:hypothetical protein